MTAPPTARCPHCGDTYTNLPGVLPHRCDVDRKFIHQQELTRRAELAAAVAELDEEFSHPDKVAETLEAWSVNATLRPCPDEDAANVSLDDWRRFADWQREHEDI